MLISYTKVVIYSFVFSDCEQFDCGRTVSCVIYGDAACVLWVASGCKSEITVVDTPPRATILRLTLSRTSSLESQIPDQRTSASTKSPSAPAGKKWRYDTSRVVIGLPLRLWMVRLCCSVVTRLRARQYYMGTF